jgi:hypothetical protein
VSEAALPAPQETLAEKQRQFKLACQKLWLAGELRFKFKDRPWQRRMYEFARALIGQLIVFLCHRRSGKSTCGIVLLLEECIRNSNTTCAIICKTKDQARAICEETLPELLGDCPRELAPRRIKNDFAYAFDHNDSKLVILAADGLSSTRIRGRKFKFILVTEAGFIDNLENLVKSILLPTTRDVLGQFRGTILLESTPSEEEDHDFEHLWEAALLDERAFLLPVSANNDLAPEVVELFKKDCGGEDSETYQREYECKFGTTKNRNAIPEFTQERAFVGDLEKKLPPIVREVTRPAGADRYASMDPGGTHLTGMVWGHYNFESDLVCIEDEEALDNTTSDVVAKLVTDREKKLWGENPDGRLLRVADNDNVILLYDLQREHGVKFVSSAKDNKDAQINKLRLMVRNGRIAIHPRCKLLIKTLRLARRAKQKRKGFEEMEKEGLGHADLLDALLYLVRNVRRHEMPPDVPTRQVQEHRNEPVKVKEASSGDFSIARLFRRGLRR